MEDVRKVYKYFMDMFNSLILTKKLREGFDIDIQIENKIKDIDVSTTYRILLCFHDKNNGYNILRSDQYPDINKCIKELEYKMSLNGINVREMEWYQVNPNKTLKTLEVLKKELSKALEIENYEEATILKKLIKSHINKSK